MISKVFELKVDMNMSKVIELVCWRMMRRQKISSRKSIERCFVNEVSLGTSRKPDLEPSLINQVVTHVLEFHVSISPISFFNFGFQLKRNKEFFMFCWKILIFH